MVDPYHPNQRMRYGPGSSWKRHDERRSVESIQHSQESLRALAKRYGISPKTVSKWRKRTFVADLRTGPKEPKSTVLSAEDEAVIIAFRRYTMLPMKLSANARLAHPAQSCSKQSFEIDLNPGAAAVADQAAGVVGRP